MLRGMPGAHWQLLPRRRFLKLCRVPVPSRLHLCGSPKLDCPVPRWKVPVLLRAVLLRERHPWLLRTECSSVPIPLHLPRWILLSRKLALRFLTQCRGGHRVSCWSGLPRRNLTAHQLYPRVLLRGLPAVLLHVSHGHLWQCLTTPNQEVHRQLHPPRPRNVLPRGHYGGLFRGDLQCRVFLPGKGGSYA